MSDQAIGARLLPLVSLVGFYLSMSASSAGQAPEVLWYQFNEGSGTTCANSAVPGAGAANATLTGHELVSGVGCGGSGALRGFAGFNNYIDTGWQPDRPIGSGWAIGFFFDWSSVDLPLGSYIVLGTGPTIGAGVLCELQWDPVNPRLELKRTESGGFTADTLNLPVSGRHLVIWNYESTTGFIRIYLDGVSTQSGFLPLTNPGLLSGGTLRVGARGTSSQIEFGMPFDMLMDDFRVYSHTLSQAEVNAWYASCGSWVPFVQPGPPPNDACASAIPLNIGLNGPFTTKYATPTAGATGCGVQRDVYFSFLPPVTASYSFETCSPTQPLTYDQHVHTQVSIYSGLGCSPLTSLAGCGTPCSTGSILVGAYLGRLGAVGLTGGTPYLLRVADSFPYYRGKFHILVTGPPPNDACSAALPLPLNGTISGDNSTASSTPSNPVPSCASSAYRDVWYSYVYPGASPGACLAATTTLSLCGAAFGMDSVIAVYTGGCGSLVQVACNDDACLPATHESVLSFSPAVGVPYLVSVSRFGTSGSGGPFVLSVSTQPGASSATGTGCGSAPAPVLTSDVPSIGTQFDLQLVNGGSFRPGYLIASNALGPPLALPGGCSVVLDVTMVDLIPFTTSGSGSWLLAVPIPYDPQLVCLSKVLQAATFSPATSTWRTSQALTVTIGP